jgi:hypothetical protein
MSERASFPVRLVDGVGRSRYVWLNRVMPVVRIPIIKPFRVEFRQEEPRYEPLSCAEFKRTSERDDAGLPIYRMVVNAHE